MQEFMGLVAIWFAQVFIIKLFDIWVIMRFSEDFVSIFLIDGCLAFADDFHIAVVVWLTAAADATAWTGHDFNGVKLGDAISDVFQ